VFGWTLCAVRGCGERCHYSWVTSSAVVPGPEERFPFEGLLAFWRDPTGSLVRLAGRYGDVSRFRFGLYDEYLLVHPEHIQRVLVGEHRAFTKGRALTEAKRILGEGLLTSEDEFHQRQRRLMQPLFVPGRTGAYGEAMVDTGERAAARWRCGDELDVHAEMSRLTLSIVGRTLFDADIEAEATEIGRALTESIQMLNRFMLPFSGLLERLPTSTAKRLRRARARLDATIYALIAERRASGCDGGDLLSLLLQARDEGDRSTQMSDEQVRDEAMTIFLAGHETTAVALTWTWYLLAKSPRVEGQLHEELARELDGRSPSVADLPRLPYTERVVAESMRLYPPAWVIGRRARVDVDLDGYRIPAGAIVILSPFVTHRDPRWYPEPLCFDPDRFAPQARALRPRYAYFPFGGGPRVCIGEGFALMEARLLLATLAQRVRLLLAPNQDVALQPRVTLRPRGGLPMSVIKR
jgi:cytochrome P450